MFKGYTCIIGLALLLSGCDTVTVYRSPPVVYQRPTPLYQYPPTYYYYEIILMLGLGDTDESSSNFIAWVIAHSM